jgi:hypothetical protein
MSRAPRHVADEVNNSIPSASVPWQLSLHPGKERWWLVSEVIWVEDEHNPRSQVIVAPDVPAYLEAQEIGLRASRYGRRPE